MNEGEVRSRLGRVEMAIMALAILARAGAVLVLDSPHTPRSTYEHGEIAANLVAGRGFSMKFLGHFGPTSQQAPIYPLLVAGAYLAGGTETPRALFVLEMGQAILGGILVLGVMRLAWEVAPERREIRILAGLVSAVHPTLVYAATHVQVVTLAATWLVWALALSYRAGRTGRTTDVLGSGVVLGLMILTDPILALAFPALGLGMVIAEPACAATVVRLCRIGAMGLIAGVVIAPWIVRNAGIHGEFVAIKSTFGYAFWQGNCRLSEGTDKVVRGSVERALADPQATTGLAGLNQSLWRARHEAGCVDDVMLTQEDRAWLGRMPEPERSRVLWRWALFDLGSGPWRYPVLCLKRLRYFLLFDETNPKARVLAYRLAHLGLSFFAVVGLLLLPRGLAWRLVPSLVVAGLITVFHALTITSARFHIPLEPLLGLWGSCGAAPLMLNLGWRPRRIRPGRRPVCEPG